MSKARYFGYLPSTDITGGFRVFLSSGVHALRCHVRLVDEEDGEVVEYCLLCGVNISHDDVIAAGMSK